MIFHELNKKPEELMSELDRVLMGLDQAATEQKEIIDQLEKKLNRLMVNSAEEMCSPSPMIVLSSTPITTEIESLTLKVFLSNNRLQDLLKRLMV